MDQNAGFLALNAGSSSLKVALFPATGDEPLVTGQAERIGPEGTMKLRDAEGNALPLAEGDLTRRIRDTDALVVMKIGRNLPRLRAALKAAGRADQAWLVEHGTMAEERVRMLSEVEGPVPYFSIVLVHGQGRRP